MSRHELTPERALDLAASDAAALVAALKADDARRKPEPSLWPSKQVRQVGVLRWQWSITDPVTGDVLATGTRPTEAWAWHTADAEARREHDKRKEAADAERRRHPFFRRCDHGVQFLNQCDECPDGAPVIPEAES